MGHAGGRGFVRFDYSGHGESTGASRTSTISRWLEDTLAVIDRFAPGRRSWSARRWAAGWRCLPRAAAPTIRIARRPGSS